MAVVKTHLPKRITMKIWTILSEVYITVIVSRLNTPDLGGLCCEMTISVRAEVVDSFV